jgi:hypothetical protein
MHLIKGNGMKRNLIVISGLALVGIAAYFTLSGDKEPIRYDPIVYEDGSTEYRLINAGKDLEKGTDDDQHWVLRFPKELNVYTYEGGLEVKQDNPKPFRGIRNRDMYFYILLPDFDLQKRRESYDDDNLLRVALNADEKRYGTGTYQERGSSFSSNHYVASNRKCRKDKEVASGLFTLRNPTETEKQAMRDEYGDEARFYEKGCGSTDPTITDYSVYDIMGDPLGRGWCYSGAAGSCVFTLWLPQNRTALFRFHKKYLMQIQSIHEAVADLITASTDINKSLNMLDKKD